MVNTKRIEKVIKSYSLEQLQEAIRTAVGGTLVETELFPYERRRTDINKQLERAEINYFIAAGLHYLDQEGIDTKELREYAQEMKLNTQTIVGLQ